MKIVCYVLFAWDVHDGRTDEPLRWLKCNIRHHIDVRKGATSANHYGAPCTAIPPLQSVSIQEAHTYPGKRAIMWERPTCNNHAYTILTGSSSSRANSQRSERWMDGWLAGWLTDWMGKHSKQVSVYPHKKSRYKVYALNTWSGRTCCFQ